MRNFLTIMALKYLRASGNFSYMFFFLGKAIDKISTTWRRPQFDQVCNMYYILAFIYFKIYKAKG